jgi:hypothetical protein
MSNPDSSDGSLGYATATSVIIVILVVILFRFMSQTNYFNVILYLGIPIIVYIFTSLVNIISQYSSCKTIDAGKAFLYGLPSIGLTLLGLLISYISWCRIPVVSVFAPLFVNKNDIIARNVVKNNSSNSKMCCGSQLTLETAETASPSVKGIAYSFYLFFTTLFGIIIGNGFSAVC